MVALLAHVDAERQLQNLQHTNHANSTAYISSQ
jgi:hypothetical protein